MLLLTIANILINNTRGAWRVIGRFVALRPKVRGFESRYSRHIVSLGKQDTVQVLHLQFPEALRRETPTQYPCCVGSASA